MHYRGRVRPCGDKLRTPVCIGSAIFNDDKLYIACECCLAGGYAMMLWFATYAKGLHVERPSTSGRPDQLRCFYTIIAWHLIQELAWLRCMYAPLSPTPMENQQDPICRLLCCAVCESLQDQLSRSSQATAACRHEYAFAKICLSTQANCMQTSPPYLMTHRLSRLDSPTHSILILESSPKQEIHAIHH